MGDTVFANHRAIACKASNGKAAAAFPDTCLSPPPPPAGPVPVPYPNTVMASDLKDGSKSVEIEGQPVFLEDKSTFSTSTGDEAGTQGGGIITHKTKGTAQFVAWSMDVQFEGAGVPRHLDMTIHNGASVPDNTLPWPYLSAMDQPVFEAGGPCDDAPKDPCKLVPYNKKCPADASGQPRTPHHLIPAHCFHPPGYASVPGGAMAREAYHGLNYNHAHAPCICVTGEDKSADGTDHQLFHRIFDPIEDSHKSGGNPGTWTYQQAKDAALDTTERVFPGTCPRACIEAQLDAYHEEAGCDTVGGSTPLRADSSGQSGDVTQFPRIQVGLLNN